MNAKISDSELEVMRFMWRENRPLSYAEIRKELERTTKWNKSTIQTLVVRLRDKGIISVQEHYVLLYTANVTEEEYIKAEGQSFIDKLFNGSAKQLVASLCKNGQLAKEDIDEMKSFFKMGGGE